MKENNNNSAIVMIFSTIHYPNNLHFLHLQNDICLLGPFDWHVRYGIVIVYLQDGPENSNTTGPLFPGHTVLLFPPPHLIQRHACQ